MNAGDTFFCAAAARQYASFICNRFGPEPGRRSLVVVPFMTVDFDNDDQDLVCRLDAGDHPFIRHPSFINFDCTFAPSLQKINAVKLNRKSKPLSEKLLNRIRESARDSHMPIRHVQILESQGLID